MPLASKTRLLTATLALLAGCAPCGGDDRAGRAAGRTVSWDEIERDARANGVRLAPHERDAHRASYLEQLRLEAAIDGTGFDASEVDAQVADMRRRLLREAYFREVVDEQVTERDVRQRYEQQRDRFETPRVRASEIFFSTGGDRDAAVVETNARAAHARLLRGEAFDTVAAEMSEDRVLGARGGDRGWRELDRYPPPVADVLRSLAPGDGAEVVRSELGWHVIALTGPVTMIEPDWDTIAARLRTELTSERREAERVRLLSTVPEASVFDDARVPEATAAADRAAE